ncbi:MAG TPA: VOC family protein [Nitrospiria bacterium]|jgi:catechol 2,3-dioxygenase-like lactoylglutathione lyase family enzyme
MSEVSVRYMIDDVPAAIEFYTTLLGFTLEHDASPAFAAVSRNGVRLLLSGEGSSGKRPLPDGRRQEPGGWNRVHLEVTDLAAEVARLRAAGVSFRTNEIVTGPGGAQVILEDPSGNPVELFQSRR